eukprot:TRINITY_DN23026_c0_g1_i1.p1 TRINITY_DN23026_c0_g1~~TRINITY_DN23026_c0_g1_i1.p1  ORF type:complete len:198 (+),score=-22.29 TRINITY_DN23026_c0_g1_i1:159-752(+)
MQIEIYLLFHKSHVLKIQYFQLHKYLIQQILYFFRFLNQNTMLKNRKNVNKSIYNNLFNNLHIGVQQVQQYVDCFSSFQLASSNNYLIAVQLQFAKNIKICNKLQISHFFKFLTTVLKNTHILFTILKNTHILQLYFLLNNLKLREANQQLTERKHKRGIRRRIRIKEVQLRYISKRKINTNNIILIYSICIYYNIV